MTMELAVNRTTRKQKQDNNKNQIRNNNFEETSMSINKKLKKNQTRIT